MLLQGKYVPDKYSNVVPAAIIGSMVIISGLLSIALPETAGHSLPETVEEANIFPRYDNPMAATGWTS